MALSASTRLGPYEILAPLGAGGMGEVYRARDPRLGRDIAIKVLPAAVSADPQRLRRFEQEARAAAALNHPNIVTIYSVERADDVPFVTMELVEGVSLARLIPRAGIPIDRTQDRDRPGGRRQRCAQPRDRSPRSEAVQRHGDR